MADPFRVLIDARMLIGRFSGIGRFVVSVARSLREVGGVQVVALCGNPQEERTALGPDVEVVRCGFTRGDRSGLRRLVWEERNLRRIIRGAGVDLFHATWNSGVPRSCPVPVVLTIHDLIPWLNRHEHFARYRDWLAYRYAMRAGAARATTITAVSEFSRRQVIDCLGVSEARVRTVYNGVDAPPDAASVWRRGQPGEPYLLYVGGHHRRKNVAGILRAMARIWQGGTELGLHLTGSAEMLEPEAAVVYRSLPDRTMVRFLGHPADSELSREYASATALVFLSLDEGFGLPVIEAMAHGCPVIASNRAALPEVAADSAVLVNPDDTHAVSCAMLRLSSDLAGRDRLSRKGRARAAHFTWTRTASELVAIYRSARIADGVSPRAVTRRSSPGPPANGELLGKHIQVSGAATRPAAVGGAVVESAQSDR